MVSLVFFIDINFLAYNNQGVDLDSIRNLCQEYSPGISAAGW